MKKITFILVALISGTAFAQVGGTVESTAKVSAEIVSPLVLKNESGLIFGQVSNTGGTVVVDPTSGLTGGTEILFGTVTASPATFSVNAATNYQYTVNLPETVTLTNQTAESTETMEVTALNHNSDETGNGVPETFNVGGTLNVTSGQATGEYKGDMVINVHYN